MRFLHLLRSFWLVLFLLMPLACAAAPSTYSGEAPVNSQSDADRAEALKIALANVVMAQTGDSGVLARADVASAVGQAERYVLQYQYRENPAAAEGGARLTLIAQFDSVAVDRMLRRLGLSAPDEAAALSETPSEATVWVGGIRNAEDYVRVMAYLMHSNFVRSVQPTQAQGDGMAVKLSLATDTGHFLEAVEMERTLARTPAPVEGADATLMLVP